MTTEINNFIRCFFQSYSVITVFENDARFFCKIEATRYTPKSTPEITESMRFVEIRDEFHFQITFGDADAIGLESKPSDIEQSLMALKTESSQQEGEPIVAEISIRKIKDNNSIVIYDISAYLEVLEKLPLEMALGSFERAFAGANHLYFEVREFNQTVNTSNITFSDTNKARTPTPTVDRLKSIEQVKLLCHHASGEQKLSPDDFRIVSSESGDIPDKLKRLFDHYSDLLSVTYLFDITSLNEDELEFKIHGYKTIKGIVNLKNSTLSRNSEYFEIYKWVYSGGNLNDKIGLARNIISLHFKNVGELELHGSPFQSIQSGYKVYEKQNIKQYIELRNKISDQLLDFNLRANKIIETFASGFQKSALALITFYISAITIKVLGKGDGEFINIFTLDATILSLTFLTGSAIYYFVSRWEVKIQRRRFIASYNNLKERYTDLLDVEDIKRILNDDKEFDQDVRFIDSKLRNYSFMWWSFILILLFSTLFLFVTYNISEIIKVPLTRLILNLGCNY